MGEGTRNVLVCYATGTGCTKGVAERIAETLASRGMRVDLHPVDSAPEPRRYDAVVAGSGVRAGSWHPAAKRWMTRNASALRSKPLALFTVGIALADGADGKDREMIGYTDRLLGKTQLEPLGIGVFAGWNDPRRFNLLERKIMRMTKAPEGDFRDWTAIEDWATSVAPLLTSPERASVA